MNTIRLIAIALPMMLLMACGGGGGGSASPTAMMPDTNPGTDDMMPGTNDPDMPPPVTLPGYAITDLAAARTAVGGTDPTSMTETQIVSAIQTRATAADTFEFQGFTGTPSATINCSNKTCSGNVPDVGTLTFSLAGIKDLSLVNGGMNLVDFDSETQAVMVDRGVTIIQSQAAAVQNDGTHLTFQTYGGWLTNTVFGVETLGVREGTTTTNRYASFSFGKESGSNPSRGTGVSSLVNWDGVMVGTLTGTGHTIQGDARVSVDFGFTRKDGVIGFTNIKNLNTGTDISDIEGRFGWVEGVFDTSRASPNSPFTLLEGSFYGDSHEEVGGIFGTSNILGAFGAKRQ